MFFADATSAVNLALDGLDHVEAALADPSRLSDADRDTIREAFERIDPALATLRERDIGADGGEDAYTKLLALTSGKTPLTREEAEYGRRLITVMRLSPMILAAGFHQPLRRAGGIITGILGENSGQEAAINDLTSRKGDLFTVSDEVLARQDRFSEGDGGEAHRGLLSLIQGKDSLTPDEARDVMRLITVVQRSDATVGWKNMGRAYRLVAKSLGDLAPEVYLSDGGPAIDTNDRRWKRGFPPIGGSAIIHAHAIAENMCPTLAYRPLDPDRPVTIGRDEKKVDIYVRTTDVSREHCRIQKENNGHWTLTDLGSANGTWLNSEPILPNDPQELRSGDRICLAGNGPSFTVWL